MTKQFDLTTLGEVMLRYSVPEGERLENAAKLDVKPGGAEGNISFLLARLGRRVSWHSALPANPLGRLVANHLRMAGVDLSGVVWSQTGRMGTYYVEFSAPPRPIQVVYDRADSCAARLQPEQVNWDLLLDTRLLHLTGITPAVSQSCRKVTQEAIKRAKAAGVTLSFDINYRGKLWSPAEAEATLLPMVEGIDLLFCGKGDAATVFNCTGEPEEVIHKLQAKTRAQRLVVSFGDTGALLWDGKEIHRAPAPQTGMIDRLGAGDALASGVLHGWLDGDLALGLRYGTMLAAMKLSQYGDMVVTTPEELASLMESAGSGIRR